MDKKIKLKGRLGAYMRWPLVLSLLLAAAAVVLMFIDYRAGAAVAIVFAVYAALAGLLYYYRRPLVIDDLISFAASFADAQLSAFRA